MHLSNKSQTTTLEILQKFIRSNPELCIILIAGFVRVVWAIAVPVIPVSDSYAYDTFAQNLAAGHGYGWNSTSLTAYWPVGTAFIYSLFYRTFGYSYVPIVVFNILLAAVTIAVSMRLAKIWFNRTTALITGLLLALWPSQIQFTTVLNSELIFTALVLIALIFWLNEHINLWLISVLVGAVLAAACYVRPTALLIPIIFLFFRWIKTQQLLKSLKAILIVFILMAVLIAPWSIRNTRVFGQFVTISTNGGANFWMGNNPQSTGGYMPLPSETEGMNEAQQDKYLKSVATAHIKEQPLLFLRRTVTRLIDTHSRESIGIAWNEKGLTARYGSSILLPLKIINQIYWFLVLGLALTGIVLLYQKHGWIVVAHPVVVIWGYFAAIHAVIVAQDRYHFPSIPMIGILAAFTLTYWLDGKRKVKN